MTDRCLPVVVVSACLLGEKVRYDGGHRLVPDLGDVLEEVAEILPVCPEAECGMGVPREPVMLTLTTTGTHLISLDGERDYTPRMSEWLADRFDLLKTRPIHGAVLKARSPSCAIRTGELRDTDGKFLGNEASGLFVEALLKEFPGLSMIDEEDAADPDNLRSFLDALRTCCPNQSGS